MEEEKRRCSFCKNEFPKKLVSYSIIDGYRYMCPLCYAILHRKLYNKTWIPERKETKNVLLEAQLYATKYLNTTLKR